MTRGFCVAVFAFALSACSSLGEKPAVAGIPLEYEIEDVRSLPQDFKAYATRGNCSLDEACGEYLLSQFRQRYFAPWNREDYLSDLSKTISSMKAYSRGVWYGENKRKVSEKTLEGLLTKCDLDRFPSMNRMAVVVFPTSMRVLPTPSPFFETPDDFPFDALQNAALKVNEPVRILHTSTDGLWFFAETNDANGWVPCRDVAYLDEKLATKWMGREQVVIIRDFVSVRDRMGLVALSARVGTILPLVAEHGDSYEVSVADKSGNGAVRGITVMIPKNSARKFPLEFNGESVALIGNELMGKPYGWGELFRGRDCSSLLRNFFEPFGIWLPRGSSNQIASGESISLAGLTGEEKERIIREKGVPFLTIIHMKGHIMLYVGSLDGRTLVFQSLWGLRVRDEAIKRVVGKAIVSTLTPGDELCLADGSLLEKVGSMLVLSERCGVSRHKK